MATAVMNSGATTAADHSEERSPMTRSPDASPTTESRGLQIPTDSIPEGQVPSPASPLRVWHDANGSTEADNATSNKLDAQEGQDDETGRLASPKGVRFEPQQHHGENITGATGTSTPPRDRQASFLGKLKSFASSSSPVSGHVRNSSSVGGGTGNSSAPMSPESERSEPMYPSEPVETDTEGLEEEESEDGGDAATDSRPKKRRKSKRPTIRGSESAPNTPRMQRFNESRFASFIREQTHNRDASSSSRPEGRRRSTGMSDTERGDENRAGLSEDEGKDKIRAAWRRGIENARGLSYGPRKNNETDATSNDDPARRPNHFRRLTGIGGQVDGATSNSPFRMKADRQTSTSAQKWRQVKAGLKMLGQRKKDERTRVDHQKSAQLMAELLAGAPAALVFASMFQRDEHGHRKLPVLLEQLKISIPESRMREEKGDRHLIFRIDLEYGNGPARMKWTISRTLKDFVNLHVKYQSAAAAGKVRHLRSENKTRAKMPKFPKTAFPYGRTLRGLFDNLQEDDDDDEAKEAIRNASLVPSTTTNGLLQQPVPITPTTEADNPLQQPLGTPGTAPQGMHKRRKSSFAPMRPRRTSTSELGPVPADTDDLPARQREMYAARQRRKLETYLQSMITWLIFRADSTRLCKFLELSTIAIRLSGEGGYQGKQGLLTITSRRNRELGRTLGSHVDRHRPRWFLVRHSYIVCVDSPESLNIYDVFLVDSDFSTVKRNKREVIEPSSPSGKAKVAIQETAHAKALTLRLYNSERKLRLLARTERQLAQFQDSINLMADTTLWSKKQRFASYAPVRDNVWCRWLVDGRDHMWQVSRAIDNAKDFVYIHDWWLSPELYLRRPAAISQEWRLDRLLLRKARQGVKIFVIVYRNIESAIPIDSEYTKWSLLDLDPNIMVQRSPNQFRQNQFFWAHHEKLVVVDNMMAFVGGVDLCFGRWDDPGHSLTDDKLTGFEPNFSKPKSIDNCQVWPGKDYSNPRVQDFYNLDRPYEEMYDRTKVPRMPWHDISMQMVGQPARDVARHFVQRWNYILRNRVPSRPTPVLLPPPEYDQDELKRVGMTGTCQVQILRSCCSWSIGTPNKVEHSIMNAYVHLIQNSDHFVYIENQFFVSACTVEGTTIHNRIGDAIVERAIRAHRNGDNWQACLVIPLMPGFQNSVDSQDGTSVRLIMQCQFRSICRGDTSIFGRLRAAGVDPEEYVRFFSLRKWGKIGPRECLTTEQLYIHAKCMVVDDRHVIIGSANINERSMLGSRDSEVAAVVTDTKMLPGFMAGEPYEVGEFPHTLRKRLMREHLGIDVDKCYRDDEMERDNELQEREQEMERLRRSRGGGDMADYFSPVATPMMVTPMENGTHESSNLGRSSNTLEGEVQASSSSNASFAHQEQQQPQQAHGKGNDKHKRNSADFQHDLDVAGYGFDNMKAFVDAGEYGFTDSYVDSRGHEVLIKKDAPGAEHIRNIEEQAESRLRSQKEADYDHVPARPPWPTDRADTYALGLEPRSRLPGLPNEDDTVIGGPPLLSNQATAAKLLNPLINSLNRPNITDDCMRDPLDPKFSRDIWGRVAENNTKLYRAVFRCMPDSEVLDWKAYERFNDYNERFMQSQGLGGSSKPRPNRDAPDKSGPPGSAGATDGSSILTAVTAPDANGGTGRQRSKSVVSAVVDKFRPRSKSSAAAANENSSAAAPSTQPPITQEMQEKAKAEQQNATPGSRQSGDTDLDEKAASPSTAATQPEAVVDEKDALKAADVANLEDTKDKLAETHTNSTMTHNSGSAGSRVKTVQYSDTVLNNTNTNNSNGNGHIISETSTTIQPTAGSGLQHSTSQKRRRRAGTKTSAKGGAPEELIPKDEAEDLLNLIQGHLVQWPYDWLEKEERGGNWLYNIDQLAPLEIYD